MQCFFQGGMAMQSKTRTFETRGPVDAERNYVVPRTTEVADLVQRIKEGRYIVIFAPRQTGKTTFFRWALSTLEKNDFAEFVFREFVPREGIHPRGTETGIHPLKTETDVTYLPIQLNFEEYKDVELSNFYTYLKDDIRKEIENSFLFRQRAFKNNTALCQFLKEYPITDHVSLRGFFEQFQGYLNNCKVTIIIDEFDGIPQSAVSNVLHSLRRIYLSGNQNRCPYSLEREYLPEDTDAGFFDYLTDDGRINMRSLIANFRDFIARAGYRILEVPETPQEFVGQYLLFAYLDQFVRQLRGFMYLEVNTGRGRMDLIILHKEEKYIIETKIWEGKTLYQAGKEQLATYLRLEGAKEGYYIVFDHRLKPEAKKEEEIIEGKSIVSYTIPVLQKRPSSVIPTLPH